MDDDSGRWRSEWVDHNVDMVGVDKMRSLVAGEDSRVGRSAVGCDGLVMKSIEYGVLRVECGELRIAY